MAPFSSTDLLIGVGALVVAVVSIYMFIRASGGRSKPQTEPKVEAVEEEAPSQPIAVAVQESGLQIPKVERHLRQSDVERARSNLRTLTLQRELLSMVLKRLFEAEDEEEITREERLSLSKGYEDELKRLSGELKRAELMVTLHELESIRDEILKKFESTLNETQTRIDTILKELKIEKPKKAPVKPLRKKPEKKEEEEKPRRPRRRKPEVEERLEQLRREVLKELEELEKLEIEV